MSIVIPTVGDLVHHYAMTQQAAGGDYNEAYAAAITALQIVRGRDGVLAGEERGRAPGWTCPKSPTGYCVYDDVEDPDHDSCTICGDPSERK